MYVDASRNMENAPGELRRRLRNAPPVVERAIEEDHTPGTHGFVALVNEDELALAEPLPHPPPLPLVETGPVPRVMPMLEQRGEEVSWLRVVVDRTGGAIEAASAGRSPRLLEVEGSEDYPIRKSKPGGWSAPRYQRAVEVTWERNAGDVAVAVTRLAEDHDAEVLIVAGDVRARQLLVDQLPKIWRERVVQTESEVDQATQVAVSAVAAARLHDVIDRYGVLRGQNLAATGLEPVVSALQRNLAESVLLAPTKLGNAQLWIGPAAEHIALRESELADLGLEPRSQVRADEALVRAAAGTGAELYVVEPSAVELADGVGVVLRGSLSA